MAKKPNRFTAQVTTNGRVTIPDKLRDCWTIHDGDIVELVILNVQHTETDPPQVPA